MLPVLQIGWHYAFGPSIQNLCKGNRSRRNLHGNQEEGKKEETLTVGETILRTGREFQPASQEEHFLRGFSFCGQRIIQDDSLGSKFSISEARVCHNIDLEPTMAGEA